jgi:hypothetical protein
VRRRRNTNMDLRENSCIDVNWICLDQNRASGSVVVFTAMNHGTPVRRQTYWPGQRVLTRIELIGYYP